jgi:hypothetical protein
MFQDSALDPGLAWFAVLLLALLMLLNSMVVFILFWSAGKHLQASQPTISSLMARVVSGTTALRQLLSHVEAVPAKLAALGGETPPLLVSLADIVRTVDKSVERFVDRSRSYLHDFDRTVDTALSNFSTQTFRVHRAVIHPAIRFSTLLRSINVVASRLFRDEEPPASHSPDQEIFI